MAAKRTKKTVVSGVTREQYEQAFAEFAMADAKAQSLTAKMDQEMTKIREKYADQLAELNETKDRTFEVMQTFATENKDTLFSKKKKEITGIGTRRHRFPHREPEAEEYERLYLGSRDQPLQRVSSWLYQND